MVMLCGHLSIAVVAIFRCCAAAMRMMRMVEVRQSVHFLFVASESSGMLMMSDRQEIRQVAGWHEGEYVSW